MTDKKLQLQKNLARYDDRQWLDAALDVLKSGLESLALESDHPALSMTVNSNGSLNINIGQRWIWKANDDRTISYILPLGTDTDALSADSVMLPFTRKQQPDALWVSIPFDTERGISPGLKRAWLEAVEEQLQRTKKSGFKKFHSSDFWAMVMLTEAREEVMNKAFGLPSSSKIL